MFDRVSERKMRRVQVLLLTGWCALIASLLWDPWTAALTGDGAALSVASSPAVVVQGQALDAAPYALGARVWWTMIIPLLPLFFMVFGHETWRRICPLSLASQLPRLAGRQRSKVQLQRRTGQVRQTLVLMRRNGWLHRNVWYVQFGLLYLALVLRLLLINSDRTALALFLAGVIATAVVVGHLWGGKTWCNYVCPVNLVQKIYTEPRGLLDSAPHRLRIPITQSSCRVTTPQGERSACVGCTPNCGDVDLERSYWESIRQPARRHVYYLFFGLVVGFYGHYYLYAGTWDYYFSGIWTHEQGLAAKLWQTGLVWDGRPLPIPKIVSAPLVLALSSLLGLALGTVLEKLYRWSAARGRNAPSEAEIIHRCLSVSAFVSISAFYVFAGRPSLLLLPPAVTHAVDVVILAATTLWLWQALRRSPRKYRREALASHLLEQLRRLKVEVALALRGRRPERLMPDEIYALAQSLPAGSREQKSQAYKRVLDEVITTGTTRSPLSLELLDEMRSRIGIAEQEHLQLLDELGHEGAPAQDANGRSAKERLDCLASYAEIVGSAVVDRLEAGVAIDALMHEREWVSTISVLRASFQIADGEHQAVMQRLVGAEGKLMQRAGTRLEELLELCGARFCIQSLGLRAGPAQPLLARLRGVLDRRVERRLAMLLSLACAVADEDGRHAIGRALAGLAGDTLPEVLERAGNAARWPGGLPADLAAGLQGGGRAHRDGVLARSFNFREVIRAGAQITANLHLLCEDDDPVCAAIALELLGAHEPNEARTVATRFATRHGAADHWLLGPVVARLRADDPSAGGGEASSAPARPAPFEVLAALARCEALGGSELDDLARLAAVSEVAVLDRGVALCRAGDPMTHLQIIFAGGAEARTASADGSLVSIRMLGAGDNFGGLAGDRSHRASVEVSVDRTSVIRVPAARPVEHTWSDSPPPQDATAADGIPNFSSRRIA